MRAASDNRGLKVHERLCCSVHFNSEGVRFASGSEDNTCQIWDLRNPEQRLALPDGHSTTVMAIAWSPKDRSRIATGGRSNDRYVKVWDLERTEMLVDVNGGSQVCNLFWSPNHSEIVSTEEFAECTVTIWNESDIKIAGRIRNHHDQRRMRQDIGRWGRANKKSAEGQIG
jgi:WD40 repeat protein